jgi:hypothetical protein
MADAAGDLGLAAKARERLAVGGGHAVQHLDGHALSRQAQVPRRPHRAHAAFSEEVGHFVGIGEHHPDADLRRRFCHGRRSIVPS